MWGDVTPAERLRAVTRRSLDDDALAIEAADALAGFAAEPASLVVACRRVLAHHRAHAPLWWVCARVLAAADAAGAARDAARLLETDRTGERLGATLPLLDEEEVVAVIGWPAAVDEAMIERFDLDVVALRVDGVDPTSALRRRRTDHPIRIVDPWDPTLTRVARLLAPAHAIGADTAVVPLGTTDAIATLRGVIGETWLVGGVGRVLPGRMFTTLVDSLTEDDETETISLESFDRLAGPRGVERPHDAAGRVDCPTVPELLKRVNE